MSFLTASATAMDAADLLQSHIKLTVENSREKLQRTLMPTSEAMVTLDTMASKVEDYFTRVSLQQKRKTASFLRSEATYYRNRRERLQADDLLGQLQDMYQYTNGPLQEVQDFYASWERSLPPATAVGVRTQLSRLKKSQGHLDAMSTMVRSFFDDYGDALRMLGLPKGRFVQATEALLHPTPVLDYMHAAETHIDILCSSWIAHNAAVQRVNEVMADARRSMEYEVAVCELVRIREDVEATFVRFVAAVDGIKAIAKSIEGPAMLNSSTTYLDGRTISVETLLQARTQFKAILQSVEGCRQDAQLFCAHAQALLEIMQQAVSGVQRIEG